MTILHLWTNGDHITQLAETIYLEDSLVGLVNISGKIVLPSTWTMKPLFLCCNFIEDVYINNLKLPVLSVFTTNSKGLVNSVINHVTWLRAETDTVFRPRLFICNDSGDVLTFQGRGIYCTLQIKQYDDVYC